MNINFYESVYEPDVSINKLRKDCTEVANISYSKIVGVFLVSYTVCIQLKILPTGVMTNRARQETREGGMEIINVSEPHCNFRWYIDSRISKITAHLQENLSALRNERLRGGVDV